LLTGDGPYSTRSVSRSSGFSAAPPGLDSRSDSPPLLPEGARDRPGRPEWVEDPASGTHPLEGDHEIRLMTDDNEQTNSPPPEFVFSSYPSTSLSHDRRNGAERRRHPRPAEAGPTGEATPDGA